MRVYHIPIDGSTVLFIEFQEKERIGDCLISQILVVALRWDG